MKHTHKIIAAAVAGALSGCGPATSPSHSKAMERLEYHYIMAFKDAPGSKKCLKPKQLDAQRWFTLCGINEGGPALANAGLWELREENGAWAAYASNGKAAMAQKFFVDDQIKPPETPPQYDTGKARGLFPA